MKILLFTPLFLLFSSNVVAQSSDEKANQVLEATLSLKKAHVEREWSNCMDKAENEARCKKLLSILWEQEKTVLGKLGRHMNNPIINPDVLGKQSTACYDPSGDYSSLIKCWERLDDRVEQAIKGETILLKSD